MRRWKQRDSLPSGVRWSAVRYLRPRVRPRWGVVFIVVCRMMYEMYVFESYGGAFGRRGADDFFFQSFLGSILYGHGNPRNVPKLLCTSVGLVCDTLFFTIVANLGTAFSCFTDAETSPTNATVKWLPPERD